jgi:hypothetical protein
LTKRKVHGSNLKDNNLNESIHLNGTPKKGYSENKIKCVKFYKLSE